MNDNELNNRVSSDTETYRATTNLNIDLENPQVNINSAVGVNIKNLTDNPVNNDRFSNTSNDSYASFGMNSYSGNFQQNYNINLENQNSVPTIDSNFNVHTSFDNNVSDVETKELSSHQQFIPNASSDVDYSVGGQMSDNSSGISPIYAPTMEEKKQERQGFTVAKELKVTFFIVFVLLIFLFIMPYIYDFLKELELAFMR